MSNDQENTGENKPRTVMARRRDGELVAVPAPDPRNTRATNRGIGKLIEVGNSRGTTSVEPIEKQVTKVPE